MVKAWTVFSFCWATRSEFGKERALWHICLEQVLLFAGIELLPYVKSQERLNPRNGFTGQDDQLELGIWNLFCLVTLTHLGCLPRLCSLHLYILNIMTIKQFSHSHKHSVQAGWAVSCLRCKTRSKGKKKEPINSLCRCFFRSVDKFDYRRERKAPLLS